MDCGQDRSRTAGTGTLDQTKTLDYTLFGSEPVPLSLWFARFGTRLRIRIKNNPNRTKLYTKKQ